MYINMIYLIFT